MAVMAAVAAGFGHKHYVCVYVCVCGYGCLFLWHIEWPFVPQSHTHIHTHKHTLMTFSWPTVDECKKCGQIMEGSGFFYTLYSLHPSYFSVHGSPLAVVVIDKMICKHFARH